MITTDLISGLFGGGFSSEGSTSSSSNVEPEGGGLASITQALDLSFLTNILNDTLFAVFQNGFDLSCWNSTFTPSSAQIVVQEVLQPYLLDAVNEVKLAQDSQQLQPALNELSRRSNLLGEIYKAVLANNDWRNCSKDSLQDVYIPAGEAMKVYGNNVINEVKRIYNITVAENVVVSPVKLSFDTVNEWGSRSSSFTYPKYNVGTKKNVAFAGSTTTQASMSWIAIAVLIMVAIGTKGFKSKMTNPIKQLT